MAISIASPSRTSKYRKTTEYQAFCARQQARYRVLGVLCYLGFAPLFWLMGIEQRKKAFLHHHYRHSLAISLVPFFILTATGIIDALDYGYVTLLWKPKPDDSGLWLAALAELMGNLTVLAAFTGGFLAWLIGILGAWRGRTPHIPLLSRLAHHTGWTKFALGWSVLVCVGVALLIFAAVHGAILTRAPANAPQAYILYTNGGYIPIPSLWASYTPPTWTISLFFYPIVVAAEKHWGPGSVAIQPLSEQTFRDALQKGRFIFVASHGGKEPGSFSYSFEPDREFLPADLKPGEAGEQLRFVYFAACYAGNREAEWRQVLAPAEVMSYARISYVEEHFIWVWTKGAKTIMALE